MQRSQAQQLHTPILTKTLLCYFTFSVTFTNKTLSEKYALIFTFQPKFEEALEIKGSTGPRTSEHGLIQNDKVIQA